jgi:hypothetical protein
MAHRAASMVSRARSHLRGEARQKKISLLVFPVRRRVRPRDTQLYVKQRHVFFACVNFPFELKQDRAAAAPAELRITAAVQYNMGSALLGLCPGRENVGTWASDRRLRYSSGRRADFGRTN